MRSRSVLAVAAAAAIALAACSSTTSPGPTASGGESAAPSASASVEPTAALTKIRVQLPGPIDAEFAGYIAAQVLGYYGDQGLDVQLVPAPASGDVVQLGSAASGPELTIADVVPVLAAREHGSDLVDIAQIFQRSGTVGIARSKVIGTTSDFCDLKALASLRVGLLPSPGDVSIVSSLAACGLTAGTGYRSVVVAPDDVSALLAGKVQVTQGEIYDEYARVLEAIDPSTKQQYTTDDVDLLAPDDQQSNTLEDAVFARSSWLATAGNADVASGFLEAAIEGWVYCRDHQEDCVQFSVQAGANLGTTHQRWMLNEVNALIWPSPDQIGEPNAVQWQRTIDVALGAGLITARPGTDAFDDTYLQEASSDLLANGTDLQATGFQKLVVAVAPGGK